MARQEIIELNIKTEQAINQVKNLQGEVKELQNEISKVLKNLKKDLKM